MPQLIFQDETFNIVTSIATTKTLISLDGAHSQTLLAFGLSNGEVVLLLIDRPLEKQSESTFTCTTLSRIKVSDIKILNVYLVAEEESTDKTTFCVDLLASNGRTELIRTSLSLERMEGQYRLVSAQTGTFTVGIKTQYICIQLIKTPSVLVAGDTKGNIFVFDYQAPGGEAYQQLKAHKNERVISLYYCATTHQLYSTSKDNYINLYRLSPETLRLSKTTSLKEEGLNVIQCLSLHPKNRRLIVLGFYGNYAYLWNKQDHQ